MGKKKTRSATTSKGERRNVVAGLKDLRRGRSELEKMLNKIEAWRQNKNPWITVPGPASNARMVRVRSNSVWGDPKKTGLLPNIYRGKAENE